RANFRRPLRLRHFLLGRYWSFIVSRVTNFEGHSYLSTLNIRRSNLPLTPAWVHWSAKMIRNLPRGRYLLMNWLCLRPIKPFICQLGITKGRMSFICDARDGIAREVCFMGYYEPQETVLMLNLLR